MTKEKIRYSIKRMVSSLVYNFYQERKKGALLKDYNIKANKYLHISNFTNPSFTYDFFYSYGMSFHLPNSISKIEEALIGLASKQYNLKVKEEFFKFSFNCIIFKEEVKMILCLDKNKIYGIHLNGSSSIVKQNPITKKRYFEGLTLFIEESFTESDVSKSLYKRLQKSYIPCLIKNDVKVSIVSKEYLERNVFNTSIKIFTPLEKTEYIEGIIDKIKTRVSEQLDIPF